MFSKGFFLKNQESYMCTAWPFLQEILAYVIFVSILSQLSKDLGPVSMAASLVLVNGWSF